MHIGFVIVSLLQGFGPETRIFVMLDIITPRYWIWSSDKTWL